MPEIQRADGRLKSPPPLSACISADNKGSAQKQRLCSREVWKAFSPRPVRFSESGRPAGANPRPSWVEPLLGGFPVFGVTLAGSRPGGRPSFLLRQERRQRRRPGFTGRPSADSPALLTTGGRRRTRPSGSDRCAGLPRPLLCCSAVQTGFHAHRAFTDATSQITGQSHEPLITCISGPL